MTRIDQRAVRNDMFEVFSMLFVGIDIAKRNHEAAIIDQAGKTVRRAFRFANSHTGYNKLVKTVRELDEPVVFGMEATRPYLF